MGYERTVSAAEDLRENPPPTVSRAYAPIPSGHANRRTSGTRREK
jgi:hypothetical protein